MKKKLLILVSFMMILTGAFSFVGTQMVGAQEATEPTWIDITCTTPGSYTYATTEGVKINQVLMVLNHFKMKYLQTLLPVTSLP